MDEKPKEVNTKVTQSILVVFMILGAIAVLLWLVLTPKKEPAPQPLPKEPVVTEETILPSEEVVGGVMGGVVQSPVKAVGPIKPPRLVKEVAPVYPEIARQARVEGVVIIEATTDIYGRVISAKVLRSIPLLDQAAIDAVRQWQYEPLVIDGKARLVVFTVTVRFQLK